MPELPEVQTIVNELNSRIVGRKIIGVWSDWPKTVRKPDFKIFEKEIRGAKIVRVDRRGKNILMYLSGDRLLLIHLKMTGHLLVGKWRIANRKAIPVSGGPLREKVNDYIHLIFYLDNNEELGLSDLRKFAKILFGPVAEVQKWGELDKIGPEPLAPSFKVQKFISLIGSEKRKIKQVLMDLNVIAGIGNIYSDDILWQAKVHPFRPANSLSKKELTDIYRAMRQILKKALRLRGTSISDFRDTSGKSGFYGDKRLVYQREGEKCRRCGTAIKRIKMGGRSAHYCPKCQKI